MTSVKLINHSSSTADWNYVIKFHIYYSLLGMAGINIVLRYCKITGESLYLQPF